MRGGEDFRSRGITNLSTCTATGLGEQVLVDNASRPKAAFSPCKLGTGGSTIEAMGQVSSLGPLTDINCITARSTESIYLDWDFSYSQSRILYLLWIIYVSQ
jgi:hypothetical protein